MARMKMSGYIGSPCRSPGEEDEERNMQIHWCQHGPNPLACKCQASRTRDGIQGFSDAEFEEDKGLLVCKLRNKPHTYMKVISCMQRPLTN
jgi:hypothetical protein